MASYSLLWKGDRLPSVGLVQILLNRTGCALRVDGAFGPKTHAALADFQRARNMPPDGIVDKDTWRRLFFRDELPLIDFIDVFHDKIFKQQAQYVVETGGTPVYMGGMSNGLAQMGEALKVAREVFLLRVIGHGCPGVQAISMGLGGWVEYRGRRKIPHHYPHETTAMHKMSMAAIPAALLKPIFNRCGSIELHGCKVAQGPAGRQFLAQLANLLGVPVSAGVQSQRSAIRFDGPTVTAVPGGGTLADWCGSLAPWPSLTVP